MALLISAVMKYKRSVEDLLQYEFLTVQERGNINQEFMAKDEGKLTKYDTQEKRVNSHWLKGY